MRSRDHNTAKHAHTLTPGCTWPVALNIPLVVVSGGVVVAALQAAMHLLLLFLLTLLHDLQYVGRQTGVVVIRNGMSLSALDVEDIAACGTL